MRVLCCEIPANLAPTMMNSTGVTEFFRTLPNNRNQFSIEVVIDEGSASSLKRSSINPDIPIQLMNKGFLCFAKNKNTLLRGLTAKGQGTLVSSNGVMVVTHGSYSTGAVTIRQKLSLALGTTGLQANWTTLKRNVSVKLFDGYTSPVTGKKMTTYGDYTDRETAQNALYERVLFQRGYFAFFIGRAAFTNPPLDTSISYLNAYEVKFWKAVTLINHGRTVNHSLRDGKIGEDREQNRMFDQAMENF